MKKITITLLLLFSVVEAAQAGAFLLNVKNFFTRKNRRQTTVVVPVYDTIRVVVTDTIHIEPKTAPRIDTLTIEHTPEQIDSLLDLWHTMHLEQSEKRYFEQYSEMTEGEENMAVDSLYRSRLQDLVSPVHLPYNYIVRDYINYYFTNRWSPLSRVLALSKFYFPIFEQELIAAGMPVELRTLAIIESNLSPLATSRVGAVGLWQFMPATGKNLGLEINSLVDERCDIVKSTRAACQFLRHLYKVYGDWTLAIAAYNCGPGNVKKAILRSGGSTDFWKIYPWLPRETRGYLPGFIAASYIMTYYEDHGICPMKPELPIATDTIMVSKNLHFKQIVEICGADMEVPVFVRKVPFGAVLYTATPGAVTSTLLP